jgi:predicted amidohydrolase
MTLKIALAQVRSEKGGWPGNLRRVEEYMSQATSQRCDIVIFPEMSLSGYADPARFPHVVQPLCSGSVRT